MNKDGTIYVAGHRGLAGSALVRRLEAAGYRHIITRTHQELDLEDQQQVRAFFEAEKPEYVFLAAAKVGGILANNAYPADFIYKNILIQTHVLDQSYRAGVKKLLFLGSSCIYPRLCPQPIREASLMTGPLEPTNSAYAVAKISGIEMCWAYNRQHGTLFIPVMPTNLYGPNDNFDLETSHVLPALLRKCHEAKAGGTDAMTVWGTGAPMREFLYVDDMADACIHLMKMDAFHGVSNETPLFNIGTGQDVTIRDLAERIKKVVGFSGDLKWDTTKPDGTPRKCLDVSRMTAQGWTSRTTLDEGLAKTYQWYLTHDELVKSHQRMAKKKV
ncbi:GDP-L-fucose synthase [Desulfatiferula olefinivorans]